jgi:hypothetical protein
MAATLRSMAIRDGRRAGEAAASWVFDGNTDRETYERVLKAFDEGDPVVYDWFRSPDLSGEWADSPTPQTMADEWGMEPDDERLDDLCTLWEERATETFWDEIERECKRQLKR